MELARNSPHDALIAYLKEHHTLLVELLPSDTNCADLFGQVECGRTIDSFFYQSDDRAVSRALERLTQKIQMQWLVTEKAKLKEQQKRDKRDAAHTARKKRKTGNVVIGEGVVPLTLSIMPLADAALVVEHTQDKNADAARKTLLIKGYTGSYRVPGTGASPHQAYFRQFPQKVMCEELGVEYKGVSFGMYSIHFPGEALERFEAAKQAIKTKTSCGKKGKVKVVTPMPYASWCLPTSGEIISWQEFFGTLVAQVFRDSDAAMWNLVSKKSSNEIGEIGTAKAREEGAKFDTKIERLSADIGKAEVQLGRLVDATAKAQIQAQINTLKKTRDALSARQDKDVAAIQEKYDGYKETKAIMEAQDAAKKAKAKAAHDALFTRRHAARPASSQHEPPSEPHRTLHDRPRCTTVPAVRPSPAQSSPCPIPCPGRLRVARPQSRERRHLQRLPPEGRSMKPRRRRRQRKMPRHWRTRVRREWPRREMRRERLRT